MIKVLTERAKTHGGGETWVVVVITWATVVKTGGGGEKTHGGGEKTSCWWKACHSHKKGQWG